MCQEAFPRGRSSDQINKVGDNARQWEQTCKATEAGLRAAVPATPPIRTDSLPGLSGGRVSHGSCTSFSSILSSSFSQLGGGCSYQPQKTEMAELGLAAGAWLWEAPGDRPWREGRGGGPG